MSDTSSKSGVWREILKPTLVLIIIATLVGLLLAFTYNTADIAALKNAPLKPEKLAEYQPMVLPDAKSLEKADIELKDDKTFLGAYVDTGGSGSVAIHVLTHGYEGGEMKLLVGIHPDGTVAGVVYTECNETPGLGTKTNTPEFLGQFAGKSGELTIDRAGSGADIDAIGGATISSTAVTNGVNTALQLYEKIKGEIASE